jgi:hypothetical protein
MWNPLASLVYGIVTCVVPAVAVPPPVTASGVLHGTISWTMPIPCTTNMADWEGTYTSIQDCTGTSTALICKIHYSSHLTATDVNGNKYEINLGDNGSTDTLTFGLATTSVETLNSHTRITGGQGDGLVFTYSQQAVYTSTYDPVSDPANPYTFSVDVKMVKPPECK